MWLRLRALAQHICLLPPMPVFARRRTTASKLSSTDHEAPVSNNIASLESTPREKALGLQELRYFLSAALAGNLGRAARALNVSPAAVSRQLRKLEEGLGTQLLLRHGRGVTPTLA